MMSIDELFDADTPAALRDFVGYWASRRAGELMPSYGDIDPIDIPWALPHVYVVEIQGDDFIFRLAGEGVAERYKRPMKGARISDLFTEDSSAQILQRWRRVVRESTGYYSYTQHETYRGIAVRARRILLPLGEDRRTADHLIGFTVYEETQGNRDEFNDGLITRDVRWVDLSLQP